VNSNANKVEPGADRKSKAMRASLGRAAREFSQYFRTPPAALISGFGIGGESK